MEAAYRFPGKPSVWMRPPLAHAWYGRPDCVHAGASCAAPTLAKHRHGNPFGARFHMPVPMVDACAPRPYAVRKAVRVGNALCRHACLPGLDLRAAIGYTVS